MILKDGGSVQIERSKYKVAESLEKLLQERVNIRKTINNNKGCFTESDCKKHLKLIQHDEIIEDILYRIFDIQEHEYLDTSKDYIINVKIE